MGFFMSLSSVKSCAIAVAIIAGAAVFCAAGYALPQCCGEPLRVCFQSFESSRFDGDSGLPGKAGFLPPSSENRNSVVFPSCCAPTEPCCTAADDRDTPPAVIVNPPASQACGKAVTYFEVIDLDFNRKKDPHSANAVFIPYNKPLFIQIESILR